MTSIHAPIQALWYLTAKDQTDRCTPHFAGLWSDHAPEKVASRLVIDPQERYQTLLGFGGAFTESSAENYAALSPKTRAALMDAYFHPTRGHGYTMGRTHINSCDFSLGNYASSDVAGDVELKHFSLEREQRAILPMLRDAAQTAGEPLCLFASPWSPPAWMKTTGKMNGGGKLKPECRDVWARYYARYIREMEKEGFPIWGLTVQNEPAATQTWDSCLYSAEEERDFVRDHLGPTLVREGLADRKLIIWDHNRDVMHARAKVMFDDPEAAKYVWGTGFHWYGDDAFEQVQQVHDAWPDKELIFTEGCQEGGPHLGSWALGERYARSIINDLNRWTVAWVDWNLLLDMQGGPNHVGNYCSAPIHADIGNDSLFFQSSYYYLGHFSRHLRPGAQRVRCEGNDATLLSTAFIKDSLLSVVVLNTGETEKPFSIAMGGKHMKLLLPARSIGTFVSPTP